MDLQVIENLPWFQELCRDVQHSLDERHSDGAGTPNFAQELASLRAQVNGWGQSLGNPELESSVRSLLESQVRDAFARIREIEVYQSEFAARARSSTRLVDPAQVAERLSRLDEILASGNATLGNLELSHHIDRIVCYPEGRVVLRTCRLGALAGAVDLLSDPETLLSSGRDEKGGLPPVQPRRRSRLRVHGDSATSDSLRAAAEWATAPDRFSGLDERWFEDRVFQIPTKRSWAEEHALNVARYRLESRASIEETSRHFEKSVPTIRAALRAACRQGLDATGDALSLPRGRRWAEPNAYRVLAYVTETGASIRATAKHFEVSEPTIASALRIARANRAALEEVTAKAGDELAEPNA